jgi:micrococcal nuclease
MNKYPVLAALWIATSAIAGMPAWTPAFASADYDDAISFTFCHIDRKANCVVDGDTIYYRGDKIRVADIDAPETHPPRCSDEARLGEAATVRLHALVNAGAFSLQMIDRDTDVYGRKLRVLTRGGQSLGGVLVAEGLARWYGKGRRSWC